MVKRPTSPCLILNGVMVISSADEGEAPTGHRKKKNNRSKRILFLIEGKSLSRIGLFYQGVDSTSGKNSVDLIASFYLRRILDDIHLRQFSGDTVTSF